MVLLFKRDLGPFTTILNILGFIGVIVHELSHFFMCKILNVPTDGISVKFWYKGQVYLRGSVTPKEFERITFLQALMVGLAPLFISTWLIFWSLTVAFTPNIDSLLFIIILLFATSLLIGAAPSSGDLRAIKYGFQRDPTYSFYQVCLVIFSSLIIWGILILYRVEIPYYFIYYILIGVCYFILKYSFTGIRTMIYKSRVRNMRRAAELNYKSFTRKSVKPSRSYKIGIEEAQW